MTEDLTVNQRPSVAPYLLGGAALGGVGGYFVDKIPKFQGVTKAKYTSFDDILKEKADAFVKSDTNALSEELEAAGKKILEERTKFNDLVHKTFKDAAENVAVDAKATAFQEARKNALNDIVAKIKAGTIKPEGIEDVAKASDKDILAAAKKHLSANFDKEEFKAVKEALTAWKNDKKALIDKVANAVKDDKGKIWEGIKDEVAKFKTSNKWVNAAIGAAALALIALIVAPKKHKDN